MTFTLSHRPETTAEDAHGQARPERIWGVPTRLFHWSLVATVALAWISSEFEGVFFDAHIFFGLVVFVLIVFRFIWGWVGGAYARFPDFVRGWPSVRDYARALATMRPPFVVGHNPIGGWMIVALLSALFLIVASGLMINEDGYIGPWSHMAGGLARGIGELHEGVVNLLGFLIGVHIVGVLVHSVISGENLAASMFHGNKHVPGHVKISPYATAPIWRAVVVFAVSCVVVWWVTM